MQHHQLEPAAVVRGGVLAAHADILAEAIAEIVAVIEAEQSTEQRNEQSCALLQQNHMTIKQIKMYRDVVQVLQITAANNAAISLKLKSNHT
jgi:hypothetical protein